MENQKAVPPNDVAESKTRPPVSVSLEKAGLTVTSVSEDTIAGHLWFEVTDPDGHVVKVFSSHTAGPPV